MKKNEKKIDLSKFENKQVVLKTKKGSIIEGYALVYDDDEGYYIEIEQPSVIRRFYCEDICFVKEKEDNDAIKARITKKYDKFPLEKLHDVDVSKFSKEERVFFVEYFEQRIREKHHPKGKFLLIDRPLTPLELREDFIDMVGFEKVLAIEEELGHRIR